MHQFIREILQFIRENWLWIALPMVLAVVVLIFLVFMFEGDDIQPFIYNV